MRRGFAARAFDYSHVIPAKAGIQFLKCVRNIHAPFQA
jgi:hypothetical protein